jgi:hypothetical protein
VVWVDTEELPPPVYYRHHLHAQRVLARPSTLPAAEVGAIGPRSVSEGQALRFVLAAGGLNPSAVAWTATDLPPGALFDAPTGAFHFVPAADDAGRIHTVRFEGTDGVQTVGEDVAITVTEAIASLGGTVRLADGITPAAGVGLELKGASRERRTGATDAQGRWRFEGLAPGRYRVKLSKGGKKLWRTSPSSLSVALGAGDLGGLEMLATPR